MASGLVAFIAWKWIWERIWAASFEAQTKQSSKETLESMARIEASTCEVELCLLFLFLFGYIWGGGIPSSHVRPQTCFLSEAFRFHT